MSEYTYIYVRHKTGKELPKYKSYNDIPLELSNEDRLKEQKEITEYNDQVDRDLGIHLFTLSTAPSRELCCINYTINPEYLTEDILDECIKFYNNEIAYWNAKLEQIRDKIDMLETRLSKISDPTIYQTISDEIDSLSNDAHIKDLIDDYKFYKLKFEFVKDILRNGEYELIYTKS